MNVTGSNDDSVVFSYNTGSGWVDLDTVSSPSGSSGDYWWSLTGWEDGDLGSDSEVELKANYSSDSNAGNSSIITVGVDKGGPDISLSSDSIVNENPVVEVSASDPNSGVKNISYTVTEDDGDFSESTECNSDICELDLEQLSGGDYSISATSYDEVGNIETENSLSFTVDTEYDGDESPSFSVGEGDDGDDGVVTFDDSVDMDVTLGSVDSVSETTAECIVGGESVGEGTFDADSGESEFTCTIEHDEDADYYDEEAEVYVRMEDAAGNDAESDREDIIFDVEPPTVSELGSVTGLSTFNSNFDAEFDAFDPTSGSSIEEYEYFFNGDSDQSTVNPYEDGEFTVDLEGSDLDSGDHNLHVRVRDEAGRWSTSEIFEFEYFPNRDPEVSVNVPENVSVTAGESTEFQVSVENTGEFLIETVGLNISSEIFTRSGDISSLEPGESVTTGYEVSSSEDQIGEYTVDATTDNPSDSQSFVFRVRANEDQRNSIESDLNRYEERLESLEANVSELKNSVSDSKASRLDSNLSGFRNDVQEAREAVDAGEYYRAESALNGIEADFSRARDSYENVQQEYRASQRMKMILAGFAVLLLGGVGGVFILDREDVIDAEQYVEMLREKAGDMDVDSAGSGLGGIGEKISDLLDNEPEAEEFEWDGFRD